MKSTGRVLLNANVTVNDFYKVVSQFKDSCRFCVHEGGAPNQLQLKDKSCIFSWKINADENKGDVAEFYFYENKQMRELEMKICFQLKTVKESKGEVHVLTYEFSGTGYEDHIFRFFKELGGLIPKCYKKNQIKNEKWFIDAPDRNFYISFEKDMNDEMPVPESWINRFADDSYFLDATIVIGSKKNFYEYEKERIKKGIKKEANIFTENQFHKNHIIRSESKHMEKLIYEKVKQEFEISMKWEEDAVLIMGENEYKDHLKTYEEFRNFLCEKYLELNKCVDEEISEKVEENETEVFSFDDDSKNQIKENQYKKVEVENNLLKNNVKDLTQQVRDIEDQKDSAFKKIEILERKILESEGQKKVDEPEKENSLKIRINELEKKLNQKKEIILRLRTQLDEVKNSKLNFQNQTNSKGKTLFVPCSEENLFPDEIEDYLYSIIYRSLEKEMEMFPHNEEKEAVRKKDVVKNILDNKIFDFVKSESERKKKHVHESLKSRNPDYQILKSEGFEKLRESGEHVVTYFYNKRYEMVFASTSSDERRGGENKYKEIEKRLFL